jgi:ATP-binding cassette subfamily B protein
MLAWSYAGSFVKKRLVLVLGVVAASSIVTALAPLLLKHIVDQFAGAAPAASATVLMLIGCYIFSQWLARLLSAIRAYFHAQADRRMYRTLSDEWLYHIMALPLRFHLERKTGAVTETLHNGFRGYQMILQSAMRTALPVAIELGTVAIVLVSFGHTVFLALFGIAFACYGLAFSYGVIRVKAAARAASTAQVQSSALMADHILNYETVKYFTAEALIRERFGQTLERTESAWMQFFKNRFVNDFLVGSIFAAFLAVTLVYAARQVLDGRMTIGDFVLINTYAFSLVRPIETLGSAAQELSQGVSFIEKMLDVFQQTPEPSNDDAQPLPDGPGSLEFEHVSVGYESGREVLKDVNFSIPSGRTVALVGASGAGKSTLLRLLVRLIEPSGGRILMDGVPLSSLSLSELRQAIAVVPQDTLLFNDSIRYNISFGKWDSTPEEIEHAARLASLDEFIRRQPSGYDTIVGERGIKLSGGEKQRVSIARALLKRPRIYVFDEATSSLDAITERQILRQFRAVSQGSTTLIIAHRLSTIVHADLIVVLEDGAVVEQGAHHELLALGGRYASLYEIQHSIEEPSAGAALDFSDRG